MILVDTGYLLALVQPTDALHGPAVDWSLHIRLPLLVTEYVLWEMVNALSAPEDRPKAHLLLRVMTSEPGYEIIAASAELFEAGINMHRARPDKEWSLTDCISFHVMRQRGIQMALAHDHH